MMCPPMLRACAQAVGEIIQGSALTFINFFTLQWGGRCRPASSDRTSLTTRRLLCLRKGIFTGGVYVMSKLQLLGARRQLLLFFLRNVDKEAKCRSTHFLDARSIARHRFGRCGLPHLLRRFSQDGSMALTAGTKVPYRSKQKQLSRPLSRQRKRKRGLPSFTAISWWDDP
jgi:hypothetical protein